MFWKSKTTRNENSTDLYIKNIVSDTSFEMIYELNKKENIEEVNIDQMSIFEFIGDTNESRI